MGDAAAAAASPPSAPGKRRRRGGGGGGGEGGEGLRRVREPTAAERALAAEARERLAAVVAEGAVRPKDLFPGEAVRALVEDLGLNRARDPAAMGFRPPKASIADRLMLTKRKFSLIRVVSFPSVAALIDGFALTMDLSILDWISTTVLLLAIDSIRDAVLLLKVQ
uniref:Uncharacterized protein n=1 Tax=Leersia perrieri TaxID=77586 RepID=A0A0D9VKB5_9ORYZ